MGYLSIQKAGLIPLHRSEKICMFTKSRHFPEQDEHGFRFGEISALASQKSQFVPFSLLIVCWNISRGQSAVFTDIGEEKMRWADWLSPEIEGDHQEVSFAKLLMTGAHI